MSQQAALFEKEMPNVKGVKSVLVPYPVDKAYSYALPDDIDAQPGDYVTVPLGKREVPGVVWGEAQDKVAASKLKSIVIKHDVTPMPDVHRRFLNWVAQYNMAAPGAVLKMSLSVPAALEPPKPVKAYKAPKEIPDKGLSEQRKKVLEVLRDGTARRPAEIADLAGCSPGVVTGMANKGLLEVVELFSAAPCRKPDPNREGPDLSDDQRETASSLCDAVRAKEYSATLLDGVTGAGKTEVYFEAVAEALKQDKQVLILLPEIALSNAFLDRFKARFGCAPALWHSNLSTVHRRTTWRGVADGTSKVIVGARSALFLPYADLGLIIVDEEHDPAYKQEEGVMYHARDMAVVRAHMGAFPVVLVSATPSVETIHNAWNGRYEHLHLLDRFGGARLPDISLIDLREDKPESQHFIAPSLKNAVLETIRAGEQALLFLNRRGYAPLTICRSCGHRMNCPRCTAWLVEHKQSGGRLHCHHCGYDTKPPQHCPECDAPDSFAVCGPGVERIMEEVKEYFPDARTVLLASDTADNNESLRDVLQDIRDHKYDIIIGTQIIAKGHHFPGLTCVGVVDADLGLTGGELRAAERTYQLLHQVAGRAGREEKKGHVYLQTFMPEHRIMQALADSTHCHPRTHCYPREGGDLEAGGEKDSRLRGKGMKSGRDRFLEVEAYEREQAHMPPYSRLAGIIVSGRDERQVHDTAKALGQSAPQGEGVQSLGPAPAPFARLRGRFRYRLLVRADKTIDIQKMIGAWVGGVKCPSTVRIQIDIDPQSFL